MEVKELLRGGQFLIKESSFEDIIQIYIEDDLQSNVIKNRADYL